MTRRTPTAMKVLAGNPGKRPLGRPLKPPPRVPPPPKWATLLPGDDAEMRRLRADAAAEWRWLVGELDRLGLAARLDGRLIRDTAVQEAQLLQALRRLAADGPFVRTERGLVKHPALATCNQLRASLARSYRFLGIGPNTRSSMDVPGADESGGDCAGYWDCGRPGCSLHGRESDIFD